MVILAWNYSETAVERGFSGANPLKHLWCYHGEYVAYWGDYIPM
jgi:hypothetical protein